MAVVNKSMGITSRISLSICSKFLVLEVIVFIAKILKYIRI